MIIGDLVWGWFGLVWASLGSEPSSQQASQPAKEGGVLKKITFKKKIFFNILKVVFIGVPLVFM